MMSALPLMVFLMVTVVLVTTGAPTVEGMIIASMLGISAGMLVARDLAQYGEEVFSLMANRTATVAVVCWLWAGTFSGIMAASGLVEAIVWLGWKLNLQGAWLTVSIFNIRCGLCNILGNGYRYRAWIYRDHVPGWDRAGGESGGRDGGYYQRCRLWRQRVTGVGYHDCLRRHAGDRRRGGWCVPD